MKYFLIGTPLSHSFSATYFNKKFTECQIDSQYLIHELDSIDRLPKLIDRYGEELGGFNVTAPYKQAVIPFVDRLTEDARKARSVNCVRREKDGSLTGHNTDVEGVGILLDKTPTVSVSQVNIAKRCPYNVVAEGRRNGVPKVRRALVLGGGGVVGAVLTALEERGILPTVVMRDPSQFPLRYPQFSPGLKRFDELGLEDILKADIIVNCTPLGTFPEVNRAPDIPYEYIQPRHICLDLVYNPEQTVFTRICKAHGARVSSGLPMLIGQAEAGWKFWNEK